MESSWACVCLSGFPDRHREHVSRSWHARVLCRTCEWVALSPLQNPLKERETSTQFRHRSRMWTERLPLWPRRLWRWQEQDPPSNFKAKREIPKSGNGVVEYVGARGGSVRATGLASREEGRICVCLGRCRVPVRCSMGKCSEENNGYFVFYFFFCLEKWLRI